jgi:hypothetical protein
MPRKVAAPHLLRHRAFSGDALYRVVDSDPDIVEVEVVSAPGLEPGTRLRFTQAAVADMSVVAERPVRRQERSPAGDRSAGGKTAA